MTPWCQKGEKILRITKEEQEKLHKINEKYKRLMCKCVNDALDVVMEICKREVEEKSE